jgi:hypothetical protein
MIEYVQKYLKMLSDENIHKTVLCHTNLYQHKN